MYAHQHRTYHIVCHDCPFESLVSTREAARELTGRHEGTTTHSVRYARID